MARRIEAHVVRGPAGNLESLLEEPEDAAPVEACLVCHPHPLGGGTMLNKVVHRIAKAMRLSGRVVLRFNFRGVGRSEGTHGYEEGELEDARAALDWLQARYPELPYSLAGFSFGSRVILKLGCELGDAAQLIAAGFPAARGTLPVLQHCSLPKTFITSSHDEFAPLETVKECFDAFAPPKRLVVVEARDHFFAGALDEFESAVGSAAKQPPAHDETSA